jgi:hypothetical protein
MTQRANRVISQRRGAATFGQLQITHVPVGELSTASEADIGTGSMMKWLHLQRFDFHFAEFHHAFVAGNTLVILEPQAVL